MTRQFVLWSNAVSCFAQDGPARMNTECQSVVPLSMRDIESLKQGYWKFSLHRANEHVRISNMQPFVQTAALVTVCHTFRFPFSCNQQRNQQHENSPTLEPTSPREPQLHAVRYLWYMKTGAAQRHCLISEVLAWVFEVS